jgi:putative ABC transport system permease protein
MFLALRDIRHAPGRFSLIASVIALMMLLVGFLTGLTGGLASQNISALMNSGAQTVVATQGDDSDSSWTWETSEISKDQVETWQHEVHNSDADAKVTPVGVVTTRLTTPDQDEAERNGADNDNDAKDASAAVTLFATPNSGDGISLNQDTADDLGVKDGDEVSLGGHHMTATITDNNGQYSHTEVAGVSLDVFHHYLKATKSPEKYATALLVDATPSAVDTVNAEAGTQSMSLFQSLLGLESFKSEIGTLALMIGMLFAISALVVGVFFLVWSMQRQNDVSVLKALGASNAWLRKDAVGQAALVLLIAILVGTGLALGLGAAISGVAPFVVSWWTIAPPAVAMFIAGLIGSVVSLRQITRVDPLIALNAAA